jgi:hypothetical protein
MPLPLAEAKIGDEPMGDGSVAYSPPPPPLGSWDLKKVYVFKLKGDGSVV